MKKPNPTTKLLVMIEAVQFAIDVTEVAPADWYHPELPHPFRVKEKAKKLEKLRNKLKTLKSEYCATLN